MVRTVMIMCYCVDHVLNDNHRSVCAGQVTEDLMDLILSTEGQSGNHHTLRKQDEETEDARACRELNTESGCHGHLIAKRVADGNVSVNSHADQQNPL